MNAIFGFACADDPILNGWMPNGQISLSLSRLGYIARLTSHASEYMIFPNASITLYYASNY
jgi:hypothetical protein